MASRKARSNRSTDEQSVNEWRASTERTRAKVDPQGDAEDFFHKPLSWWRERWTDKGVQRQFLENYIVVRDAFDKNTLTRLKLNDLQAQLHEDLSGRDVVIKFRRGGVSTYLTAADFADVVVLSGRRFRSVPHAPDTEAEFRATVKLMFENLPDHIRPATRHYSERLIWIDDKVRGTTDSRVTTSCAQPGHEGKGRGQTMTHLHLTEPPHWRGNVKKLAVAMIEAAAGGKVAVESTPFGIEWTHSIYQDGKTGKGGWKSHFFEWWWMRHYRLPGARISEARGKTPILLGPGEKLSDIWKVPPAGTKRAVLNANRERLNAAKISDKEIEVARKILAHLKRLKYVGPRANWYCDEVAEYIAWRRLKIDEFGGDDVAFGVEYPENDVDCFENTGRTVIAGKYLKVTCDPQEPIDGHRYLIGVDTSLGTQGSDPAAIEVIDLDTGRQCYSESLLISPDLLAFKLVEISDLYNWAMVAVERNNTGVATLKKLAELVEPERIYKGLTETAKRAVADGKKTWQEAFDEAELGIATTTANKGLYGVYIEQAVRDGSIGLSSKEWCDEARTVVWTSGDKWEALPGYHDDRFIALAIANFVRIEAMTQTSDFVGVMPETGYARA